MLVTNPTLTHDRPTEPALIRHASLSGHHRGNTVAELPSEKSFQKSSAQRLKTFELMTTVFTVVQNLAHSTYHRGTLSMVTGSCPKGGIQLSPAPCFWG
jgi:hypothetical protein